MASPITEEQRVKLLRAETHKLLQSPDFIRSPVMSQLLSYLVEESISNPDTPPKAYQVAVDGLGRSEDFDVQADSYPRVQVGRLRKMLGTYYSAHKSATRLHIPIGHYAVKIAVDEGPQPTDGKNSAPDKPSPTERGRDRWFDNRLIRIALAILLLIAAAGLIWLLKPTDPDDNRTGMLTEHNTLPPKIYIAASDAEPHIAEDDRSAGIEEFFEGTFARSSQVRLAAAVEPDVASIRGQNAYLFESHVVPGRSGPEIKFQLTSLIEGETIWSTTVKMPDSPADYPDQLGPVSSRITGIFGLVATDQRKRLPDSAMIGYPCLLRFDSYRANRDPDLLPVVESCITQSLAIDPYDSEILAAASFIAFLRKEATGREPDPEQGLEYARRAMVRGRENASANFALARSSFFNGNCIRGKEFAEKAVALDPYEAAIQAQAGAFLFACGDPDATRYLRRAIALDPRGSLLAETALVLMLLAEGKDAQALEVAEKIVPSSTGVGPFYDVAMAMVYAKNGRIEDSRASWDRLVATYGNDSDESQEQLLKRLITNPVLAERAFQVLVQTGVINK
ncbi:hypothetical protein [uncultured Parasphingorhabdus sp.]|uniref:tetratricopeptide repeat protein n=1 Tax=uncultured Parasphingorhabdus sp. TaxID=2709694 RepID=UPI002AA79BD5|nr:hypothetical protein [uncultured Parasphingorhabdus sp.]